MPAGLVCRVCFAVLLAAAAASCGDVRLGGATLAPSVQPTGCAKVLTGTFSVCPDKVQVGSTITIEGKSCAPGSAAVHFVMVAYEGETSGTVGAVGLAPIAADASGAFRSTFTIPSSLGSIQQAGGGALLPGNYLLISKPAYCIAELNVVE